MRKVIAFSLWGSYDVYNYGALENALLAQTLFPDWICLIYHSNNINPMIFDVLIKMSNVELILMDAPDTKDIDLIEHICDEDRIVFKACEFWRFMAAFDNKNDIVIIRDLDARLCPKDRLAIDEWLASDKDFHILRDHSAHWRPIMGGMWGCRNKILCKDDIIKAFYDYPKPNKRNMDQMFLRDVIFPKIVNTVFVHSSVGRKRSDKVVHIYPDYKDSDLNNGLPDYIKTCFIGDCVMQFEVAIEYLKKHGVIE